MCKNKLRVCTLYLKTVSPHCVVNTVVTYYCIYYAMRWNSLYSTVRFTFRFVNLFDEASRVCANPSPDRQSINSKQNSFDHIQSTRLINHKYKSPNIKCFAAVFEHRFVKKQNRLRVETASTTGRYNKQFSKLAYGSLSFSLVTLL